mgnify:FL=1
MTRDELLFGFQAGRSLIVDRKDSPVLPLLWEMEREGLIVSELVEYDEQSSALRFSMEETP